MEIQQPYNLDPSDYVSSINTLTGDVVLSAGTNITLVPVGNTITINATSGSSVSFGTTTQLPYMNAGGTDFLYSSNLTFDGSLETVTANSLGITPDNTKGLFLVNTTSAAAGAQQMSPAIRWRGNGWKTSATAESRPVDFRSYVYTYQGSANPNGMWFLESSVNNASYNAVLGIGLAGDFYLRSGGSGSSGQVLQSGGAGIASSWLTLNSIATTGLTSGSGITASGTAVNLGGTLTSSADINANDSYRVMISNVAANHSGISYASNEPISTWTIDGSWAVRRRLIDNTDHTVDYFDSVISVKTDIASVAITFPDAATVVSRIITVKFYDDTAVNDIVVTSGGGAIQSASNFSFGGSYSMPITGQRAISWQSNGTDWEIIWTQDNITVVDSPEIDFTLTGQQITASIVASSIDEAKLDASVNASLDLADTALQSSAIGVSIQAYDADLTDLSTKWTTASASGAASLQFHEDTDNGVHKVTLIAPASVTSDKVITMPDTTGTMALTSDITGTNSGTNTGDQSIFQTIAVSGQSNVVADTTTDTLTLVAGSGVTITTDAGADSVTISATGGTSNVGTATINFGDAPAKEVQASIAVTGQTNILASSKVEAWIMPNNVANPNGHTEDEHMIENLKISVPVSTIIAGTGFTIQGECLEGTTNGKFLIQWSWV